MKRPPVRFVRYELRTSDVAAARAFYAAVLGAEFWRAPFAVTTLPERAAVAGAPPHWLGWLGTADVEATVNAVVAHGGQRLGTPPSPQSTAAETLLRDPFGAVLGVGAAALTPGIDHAVAWHVHHGPEPARALTLYTALFGWVGDPAADAVAGANAVPQLRFRWAPGGALAGGFAALAGGKQRVHPQWLHLFRVPDLEAAAAQVAAAGGRMLGRMPTPGGAIVSAGEDPQGAAFALWQDA